MTRPPDAPPPRVGTGASGRISGRANRGQNTSPLAGLDSVRDPRGTA